MGRLFTPVLVPRRHPQPRGPGDARLDPRGRRARLRAVPRLRRRVRQPGPRGGGGRRRRRGRDRPAGDQLALQQVRRPAPRRRGAADPAPQRLQDRQPDGARPHPRGRAARPDARLRPHAVRRRGSRPGDDAPGVRGDPGPLPRRDRATSSGRRAPRGDAGRPPAVADDRAALPQGLDRSRARSTASRWRATGAPTRCRSPTRAATTRTARCSRSGCAATSPRSCSTRRRPVPDIATCTPAASAG